MENASQDPTTLQDELKNLYSSVNTLIELVVQQQDQIDELLEKVDGQNIGETKTSEDLNQITENYRKQGVLYASEFNSTVQLERAAKIIANDLENYVVETSKGKLYVCPHCSQVYDKVGGASAHIGLSEGHTKMSSYFKENGVYVNPLNGETSEEPKAFASTWQGTGTNVTEYGLKHFAELTKSSNRFKNRKENNEKSYISEDGEIENPVTGETHNSIRGFLNNWRTLDTPEISEYFLTSNGYYNPIKDESFQNLEKFYASWKTLDETSTSYFLKNYPELPNSSL